MFVSSAIITSSPVRRDREEFVDDFRFLREESEDESWDEFAGEAVEGAEGG
jgi:hypothetical protein